MSSEKNTESADEKEIQRVDARRHRRGGFGKERGPGPHGSGSRRLVGLQGFGLELRALGAARVARRTMKTMNEPSARTVAAPASRSARMMTRP